MVDINWLVKLGNLNINKELIIIIIIIIIIKIIVIIITTTIIIIIKDKGKLRGKKIKNIIIESKTKLAQDERFKCY